MTTYALIHGGGYSSTCWERVTPHVDGDVILVELPGRGRRPADLSTVTLADNVAATIEDIGDAEDVVLVAHSVAGITAAHVLKEAPGLVRDVILVSCTIPPDGSAVIDHIDPGVRDSVMAGSGNGVFRIDDETCRRILCNDLDEASCQWILDIRCDETTSVLATPVDLRGFADVPVTYVRLLLDQTLPLDQQDRAIAAVGAVRPPDVVELEAGHMAMVSRPEELAAIINARRG